MADNFDLSAVFKAVTEALKENQSNLDTADAYNSNHGTHMVETFNLIQKAVNSKSDESASDQLAYASKMLRASTTSGSAKLYADGLEDAAEQFKGKEFNQKTAGILINALMGSKPSAEGGAGDFLSTLLGGLTSGSQSKPQPQAQQHAPEQPDDLAGSLLGNIPQQTNNQSQYGSGGGLLSTLLGGLNGSQAQQQQPPQDAGGDLLSTLLGEISGAQTQQQQPQQTQSGGGDLLSTLLGGLSGSTSSQSSGESIGGLLSTLLGGQSSNQGNSSGLDAKDLLSAALAYFSAKQSGQSHMQAIMQAISASSRFGSSKDRAQSGAIVVSTILNMLETN